MDENVGTAMDENVARIARAAGRRLNAESEVEAALQADAQPQYADPVAIAGLIVSIASLAWTIYNDLREKQLTREALERSLRIEVSKTRVVDDTTRDVIGVVAEETLRSATEG